MTAADSTTNSKGRDAYAFGGVHLTLNSQEVAERRIVCVDWADGIELGV